MAYLEPELPCIDRIKVCIYLFNNITCRARSLAGGERITNGTHSRNGKRTSYFVYMLLCDDGSYYTGYTSNVQSRFERHRKGRGARYTKMRQPKRIVYLQRFATRRAAMRRERQMKTLSHDGKRDLARLHKSSTAGYWRGKPLRVT
ncbi:MAG: GIY-YIG nuclease family protein [Candidatus Bathyarchaeia archaeon]